MTRLSSALVFPEHQSETLPSPAGRSRPWAASILGYVPQARSGLLIGALAAGCGPKISPGPVPTEVAQRPVRIVSQPAPDAPNLYLAALIGAGSSWDPVGAEGTALLTARALVDAGAGERSSDAMREALFPTGNAFEVVVDRDWASVRLRCHRDDALLCTSLFVDVLTRPRLDEVDVIRLRDQQLQELTDGMLADEEELGRELLEAAIYEGHRYGHPPEGRAGVLPLIDAGDLRLFHQAHYVREGMVVGAAGAVDEAVLAALADGLEAVPARMQPDHPLMSPEPVVGRTLVAADTSTPVTGFHLGHPVALDRRHEDWAAMWVAVTALGAHRQSFGRLFRALRGDRGLNYGDYAYVEPHVERAGSSDADQGVLREQNRFMVWVRPTSLENGPFALKLALDEVEAWVRDGLEPGEFDDIRAYLRSHLPLLAQDPGRRLLFALDAAATGTPDLLEAGGPALDALTVEAVNAAIGRHVDPTRLRIVAVTGEAGSLVDAITGDADTPITYTAGDPDAALAERDERVAGGELAIEREGTWVIEAEGAFR
jgi:zinc protease